MRIVGRQDRRVVPRKVGRAQGMTRFFVKLFCQPTICRSITGSDLDEAVRESLDCAREVRVPRTIREIGAGVNVGDKLREKAKRGLCHVERTDRLPRKERVI